MLQPFLIFIINNNLTKINSNFTLMPYSSSLYNYPRKRLRNPANIFVPVSYEDTSDHRYISWALFRILIYTDAFAGGFWPTELSAEPG